MIQQLKLAAFPMAAAAMLCAQSSIASAAPAPVIDTPDVTFVAQPSALSSALRAIPMPCLACPAPTIGASFPGAQLIVTGQHFAPGDRVEIVVPTGFFGERTLLDTVVTAAGGPCRASRDCPNAHGTFEFAHDFSAELAGGQISCGETLDVAATDLTPLASGNPAMAINVQTIVCDQAQASSAGSAGSSPAGLVESSATVSLVLSPGAGHPRASLP